MGDLNVSHDFECLHSELGSLLVLRMWAGNGSNQHPSANAQQWWPMSYNYQYQTQPADASQDWAAKAALWAQQRMAQEQMAQYYQQQPQVQHQLRQQPAYGGYQPDVQVNLTQQQPPPAGVDVQQHFLPEVDAAAPPLPPGDSEEPPVPGWQVEDSNHVSDNIETVAMDEEAEHTQTAEPQVKTEPVHDLQQEEKERQTTITQDYNHQPTSVMPGMQTFDHNHGFSRMSAPPQAFSHVAPQPIDYGHGHHSLDYGHQGPLVPGAQVYDYQPQFDSPYYHQHPYEMERHHRFAHDHGKPKSHPPVDSVPDLSGLNDVKKKALPLWIREGLEKLEKNKQKKQTDEGEQNKSKLNLSSSASSISGYDHGNVNSPVHSPKSNQSDEEGDAEKGSYDQSAGEESDRETEDKGFVEKEHPSKKAVKKSRKEQSSDEEEEGKTEEEKQQELVLNIRKLLTEVLLTVTNEEVKKIAQETYNEALRGPARQLQHSGGLDALRGKGGFLGLGGYGSGSESDSEREGEGEKKYTYKGDREHLSAERDDKQQIRRSRSRSRVDREEHKGSSDEQESDEEVKDEKQRLKQRDSSEKHRRKERHRSPSSSRSESSSSASVHQKSRRKKHRRRERSESSSPKRRRRHRRHHGKKSRSRSRSPRKHSSKKKRKSVSESDSDADSRHRSSKYSEKKHRRKRRSSSSSSYERDGKKDRKRKT